MRLGVVAMRPVSGELGGAERLVEGLVDSLRGPGVEAERVDIPSDESTFEAIQEMYLRCYDVDVSRFDAVISTKAPSYLVRHPNHVCLLVHTIRTYYDMFDEVFPGVPADRLAQRELIVRLDTGSLRPPRTRGVFCIGREVAERLARFNGIKGTVLHPGLRLDCRPGAFGDYLLAPGRLHRWKRFDLIIEAFKETRADLRLVICGTGEDEGRFRSFAADDPRIEFRGRVCDAELIDLYAGALAVLFTPIREDFGYVALEAFASGKPLITCADSGEPAHLVCESGGGIACKPHPESVALAIERLHGDREHAGVLGSRGSELASGIAWSSVAETLLEALS